MALKWDIAYLKWRASFLFKFRLMALDEYERQMSWLAMQQWKEAGERKR